MSKKDESTEKQYTPEELNFLIKGFVDTKEQIKKLKERHDKIKTLIYSVMNTYNVDSIKGEQWTITKRKSSFTRVSVKNLPIEIVEKYSTRTTHNVLTVRKNQKKKQD